MSEFFDWALNEKGLSMTELAAVLGYSERHLYRIRDGQIDNMTNFETRAIARFGDEARAFFLPRVSVATDIITVNTAA